MLASFQFELKYQRGTDNGAADALSHIPVSHSWETIQSLLEGAVVGEAYRSEAESSKELLKEHKHLGHEAKVQVVKLESTHIFDWEEAQKADALLDACRKWLCLRKDTPLPWWDTFLRECLSTEAKMEQSKMFFHICKSLILNKGFMYVYTTPKGETEGILAFVMLVGQFCLALSGVHHDAGHQGQ